MGYIRPAGLGIRIHSDTTRRKQKKWDPKHDAVHVLHLCLAALGFVQNQAHKMILRKLDGESKSIATENKCKGEFLSPISRYLPALKNHSATKRTVRAKLC
jgi:hypothetical protein